MLAVILKILSILGILLLILLGLALLVLLLVLFMPIVYKFDAEKSDTEICATARVRWLFGCLRAAFDYPNPGNLVVKVFWKTVFDSSDQSPKSKEKTETGITAEAAADDNGMQLPQSEAAESKAETEKDSNAIETEKTAEDALQQDSYMEEAPEDGEKSLKEKLFGKYEKIKYTIQQFCDKIKHIWNNISFYKKLLQDEQTKLLISHVFRRLGKILRHIRPRKLKADVIFGSGSPDTTGYAYGVYSMFSPQLGKNVFVTPDFTQKILVGNVHAAGHITIFTLLVNALAVLFDKRLRLLIRRLKNHEAKQNKQ